MKKIQYKHFLIIIFWALLTKTSLTLPARSPNSINTQSEGFRISLLQPAEKTRESVKFETEGLASKVLSVYDGAQKKLIDNSERLPILDTIKESDKYGNNGDKFDGISRTIVNGYEAFSNFLNTLIEKPKEIVRSVSKGITTQLDVIGGKLIGL
uniref:Secreted protein n=1 Tax=Glossina morsitans morsitans TaxID=37546 RepID=A0A1B0GB26_GLOMM